jgi:hypothetical protein
MKSQDRKEEFLQLLKTEEVLPVSFLAGDPNNILPKEKCRVCGGDEGEDQFGPFNYDHQSGCPEDLNNLAYFEVGFGSFIGCNTKIPDIV